MTGRDEWGIIEINGQAPPFPVSHPTWIMDDQGQARKDVWLYNLKYLRENSHMPNMNVWWR